MPVDLQAIKRLRKQRGWTFQEASDEAGMCGRQAWENVESGRYKAGLIILERMAKARRVRRTRVMHLSVHLLKEVL